ncbi:MAG: HDOD domain-containing protein, partial [Betaproteobacteria bacterium]
EGEMLSAKELNAIDLQDPMLCLCLLREAERRKSHRLDHETTTSLAAILQIGVDGFRQLLLSSPEIDETNQGLLKVGARARIASQLAQIWSSGRMDLNPEEVAVATLLAGCGDLLLWAYVPEIPQKADRNLQSGRAKRSAEAQTQACGFTFKDLTLQCAERWKLPALVIQLLRGSESVRAQMTRTCSNAARHVLDDSETATLALATDLVEAIRLIPNVSLEWLAEGLVMLPEERHPLLLEKAHELLAALPEEE